MSDSDQRRPATEDDYRQWFNAIRNGDTATVQKLLKDVDLKLTKRDPDGWNVFHWLAMKNDIRTLRLLEPYCNRYILSKLDNGVITSVKTLRLPSCDRDQ
jgi:ankyrin repeat protein